ncbi:lipid A deacylase LpxR family protein [Psychroserpens algicola]|uniref:Lipid A deacylase LpxR family protein n=1 Tax=Psychroserpens algicola TaxID=1719034 RepID=A0ABT0H7Z8_9FLAO|nr:lipid A deacylase LpxR family protein [Psychroserpens algicola]MCK8479977.1 lipid A deacylase LpxR family protein [Psychroserpens algicola]
MMKSLICFSIMLFFCNAVFAQKLNHFASFRTIESDNYFRFNYDNDYFAALDENYTQGYNLEFVSPVLAKNPILSLLVQPKAFQFKSGLALEHIGYTPNDYHLPDIQFGDRPFAAAIMIESSVLGIHNTKKIRMHSSLKFGLIGPGAFGKEMQVGIHNLTGNKTPRGWKHQIKNDIIINYNLGIEKQLVNVSDVMSLQVQSHLNIGTLFTNVSVGTNVIIGKFQDFFTSEKRHAKFQIYTYIQPVFSAIAYDATLQGGLFNRESPYTISSNAIKRFTAQYNYGFVIQTRTLFFEYTRSVISKEFQTGTSAKWGGVRIGFTF